MFLNTSFLEMRFGLQTCIGVESIKEIPAGLSNLKAERSFSSKITLDINSKKRLHETKLKNKKNASIFLFLI